MFTQCLKTCLHHVGRHVYTMFENMFTHCMKHVYPLFKTYLLHAERNSYSMLEDMIKDASYTIFKDIFQ